MQGRQFLAPDVPANEPVSHSVHAVWPMVVANAPVAHAVHAVAAAVLAYVPGAHSGQLN